MYIGTGGAITGGAAGVGGTLAATGFDSLSSIVAATTLAAAGLALSKLARVRRRSN